MAGNADGALSDLRVLEVGGEAGAWCGKLLADMGATVIKVEPPEGDPTRSYGPFYQDQPDANRSLYFWHYNTNKASITLNLNSASGQEILRSLVGTVDVVVDSFSPGQLDSLGIGYAALEKLNPRLIMAAITPYGQQGPRSDYAATDLTILAGAGPAWSCGYDDHSLPPVRGGGNQGYHTGCHFAVIGILVALTCRHRTGRGQFVDVNMHAASNVTTEAGTYNWNIARETVQRQTGRHASPRATPPSQMLCRDGHWLNMGIGARSEEQWLGMLAWLDEEGVLGDINEFLPPPSREALAQGDPKALEQRRRVLEAVETLAKQRDAYELFRKSQGVGLQWGIVYSPDEVIEDPHLEARGFPVEVAHPELNATFRYPGAPYRFGASPWAIRRRAPLLGEDNHAIYVGEMGFNPAELAALAKNGVI